MFNLKPASVLILGLVAGIVVATLIAIMVLMIVQVAAPAAVSGVTITREVPVTREVVTTREILVTRVVDGPTPGPTVPPAPLVTTAPPGNAVHILGSNGSLPDPTVLNAIAAAVPWPTLTENMLGTDPRVALWAVIDGQPEIMIENAFGIDFSPDEARLLLEAAGLPPEIPVILVVPESDPELGRLAEGMVKYLREVGFVILGIESDAVPDSDQPTLRLTREAPPGVPDRLPPPQPNPDEPARPLAIPTPVTANGAVINTIDIDGSGTNQVEVRPGAEVSVALDYQVWSIAEDQCEDTCIVQLVAALDADTACVYDGTPGEPPGVSQANVVTLRAPDSPGVYPLRAYYSLQYTCEALQDDLGLASWNVTLGYLIVE